MKFGAICCLYDDYEYLEPVFYPNIKYLEQVLFLINDKPWNGKKDNAEALEKIKTFCAKDQKFKIIRGQWKNEVDQRNFGLSLFYKENIEYAFIIDSDEVYDEQHFINIIEFVKSTTYVAYHVEINTYWKKYYRITPRENLKALVVVKVPNFLFTYIRQGITSVTRVGNVILNSEEKYNGTVISPEYAICYHLSYARNDEYIKQKISTFGHASEIIPNWYENVWLPWNPRRKNLHPTMPTEYGMAIKEDFVNLPDQLKVFIKKEKERTCSIIILNWNSCDLLQRCLALILQNTKRNYELVIVDNGSKDESVEFIKNLNLTGEFLKNVIKVFNDENFGFAKGINSGIKMTSDTDLCLLNVDAEPQPEWLENLYQTMNNNGSCGVVGPIGNEVEPWATMFQQIPQDVEVPMLSGYCFLIFRELFEKIGFFDERFEIGSYEDNDYCMRAQLAGYFIMVSKQSVVYHKPHQVFLKNNIDREAIQAKNKEIFFHKVTNLLMSYGNLYDFFKNRSAAKKLGLKI